MMNNTKYLFILMIVVLTAIGFWFFFYGGVGEVEPLVVSQGVTGITQGSSVVSEVNILETLFRLQKIEIDTNFFKEKTFKSLVGTPSVLPQIGSGRTNPFASVSKSVSPGGSVGE